METEKENVWAEVIGVFQQVLPYEKEEVPHAVDMAQQVGRKQQDNLKPCSSII